MPVLAELISPYRCVAVMGMAKNTGKTTTLNHLIRAFHREKISVALTGIGRDGEGVDVVTNTEKPRIFAYRGTVIATAEGLLPFCDISKELLAVTDMGTPLGRVVLVRALTDGYVQLGGPSINAQLLELLSRLPGEKILVDGAINRKTQILAADAAVLCTGAAVGPDMRKTIAETRHWVDILTLPKYEEDMDSGSCVHLSGAVTDAVAGDIAEGTTVVARDAGKIFISAPVRQRLAAKNIKLAVMRPIHLVALTVNPTSPYDGGYNPEIFLKKMQEAVKIPVYDVGR